MVYYIGNRQQEEVLFFENHDLTNIVTPVHAHVLRTLLLESKYDSKEINYLCEGFEQGFSLEFEGNDKVRKYAPNLKLRVGSKTELWNKMMTEVKDKRFAGPYESVPFEHFIQSPVGLVPKDKGTKTRLIFHLSYPRDGDSVNSGIPHEKCTVQYPEFDQAVKLCLKAGKHCKMSKSDMSRAFRNVPLRADQWHLLTMKAEHPVTGKVYYFVDKCLPFGSSISCTIFQRFSNAVAHIVSFKTKEDLVNYLDDYFFAALLKSWCDEQAQVFLDVCQQIGFPVALEKTFWGNSLMTFLGLLLDSDNQVVCIPVDKLQRALDLVRFFLNKRNKKATVLQFQKLCGFLNFLCRCVVPGRTFVRRLYLSGAGKTVLKPHHHIKITEEHRLDLEVWLRFLTYPSVFYRPFMDFQVWTVERLDMYSDASRNFDLGFGAYCGNCWTVGQWNRNFMEKCEPSIEYLELFALVVGVLNWIKLFKN